MFIDRRNLSLLTATALVVAALGAEAQTHVAEFGDYSVRSIAVLSQDLAPSAAREYGIEQRPDLGVLNTVVLPLGDPQADPVPARVEAQVETLLGRRQEIVMRESRSQGRVSYFGTFDIPPRSTLRFEVRVQPEGTVQVQRQTFEFQPPRRR